MVTDELFRFGGKAPYKVNHNHDLIGIIIFADQLIFPHDRGMWLLQRASKTTEASLGSSLACTYLESVSGYWIGHQFDFQLDTKCVEFLAFHAYLFPGLPLSLAVQCGRRESPEIILKSTILYHCFLSCAELGQLSGVAAILRFPLPDLEDSESDDSDGQQRFIYSPFFQIVLIYIETTALLAHKSPRLHGGDDLWVASFLATCPQVQHVDTLKINFSFAFFIFF